MRVLVLAATAAAFMAGAAYAQSLPAEVKLKNGAFIDHASKPLYTFTMDTMRQMSHCEGKCAESWPPLLAKPGSKPVGDWYTVKRENGALQWAYKNHPVYTSTKDKAGKPATAANDLWLLAKP